MASIRLDKKQEYEIKKSGINKSEFVRRAVDRYILHLKNPYEDMLLLELESWIEYERTLRKNVNTTVTQQNTTVTQQNTNVLTKSTDVPEGNTNNMNIPPKSTSDMIETRLHEELPMIQRLLLNPENMKTIPDCTLKLLSKKHDISKSTIQSWITENKERLLEMKFETDTTM